VNTEILKDVGDCWGVVAAWGGGGEESVLRSVIKVKAIQFQE
jgi:hypothetical protein